MLDRHFVYERGQSTSSREESESERAAVVTLRRGVFLVNYAFASQSSLRDVSIQAVVITIIFHSPSARGGGGYLEGISATGKASAS